MTTASHGKKALKIACAVAGALVVVAGVSVGVYCDNNLHAEERLIARALDAGFQEKQATVDGATVNYAEGPDNGPALVLVHGQGMEWEDYASVLPELSKCYHVFAVDCFGHGESAHDPSLYTCSANGDALIAFAGQVVEGGYIVSGHSSGGILAAYVATHDPEHVSACILEDPPLFRVTPDEVQENSGAFAWYDGYTVAHSFLQQKEITAYPAWYASHSYLFGLFGGLQRMLAEQTAAFCDKHPSEHAANAFVPRDWTRGMYFMDDWDPRFGEAFYDGSWMAGIDQEAMLQRIECPVVYLKASTNYGDDGILYAATTDDDAARIQATVPNCETIELKSGHDIHYEHPAVFADAIDRAAANAALAKGHVGRMLSGSERAIA